MYTVLVSSIEILPLKYFHSIVDPAEASALYRELSLRLHPDRGGTADDFRTLNEEYEAWKVLFKYGRLNPIVPPIPHPAPQSASFVPQSPPIVPRNPVAQAVVDELQAGVVQGIRFFFSELLAPDPSKKRKRKK